MWNSPQSSTVSNRSASAASCRASQTRNRAVRPRSRALSRARAMAAAAVSIPVASSPMPAAMSTCSPVPQPTSRTRPRRAPASASAWNTGWGRPISHGGVPVYMASKLPACPGRARPGKRSARPVSVMAGLLNRLAGTVRASSIEHDTSISMVPGAVEQRLGAWQEAGASVAPRGDPAGRARQERRQLGGQDSASLHQGAERAVEPSPGRHLAAARHLAQQPPADRVGAEALGERDRVDRVAARLAQLTAVDGEVVVDQDLGRQRLSGRQQHGGPDVVFRAAPVAQLAGGVELLAADAVASLVVLAVQVAGGRAGAPQPLHAGAVTGVAGGADEVIEGEVQRLKPR